MKILTIGRDESCDIIIDDVSNQVSRRHALIRIYPFGKMEIVPLGRNKTYLNSKEIKNEIPCRVRKSDVVSFAKVSTLDWKSVKDPYAKYRIWAFACPIVLGIIMGVLYIIPFFSSESNTVPEVYIEGGGGSSGFPEIPSSPDNSITPTDSVSPSSKSKKWFNDDVKKKQKSKKEEQEKEEPAINEKK